MVNKTNTVISTFAGVGGSSLGYKWAGYKELLAIDFDNHATENFKLNFPDIPVWEKDISTVKGDEILDFCKLKKYELDILDGSPPCQGFSTAGKRKINDPRNSLFREFVRLITDLQPKIFVMENVSGLVKGKMKGVFIEIMQILKEENYIVKCKLLNAKYYGVPQSRQRLFFIGIRKDLNVTPTFPPEDKNVITTKEALQGVELSEIKYPAEKIAKYYDNIQMGKSLAEYLASIGGKPNYFNLKKLHPSKPSNTITKMFMESGGGLLHWREKRFITINELKRLSTFPDDFIIKGKFSEQWARIGNAVMPKQMYYIAKHVKQYLQ